MNTKAAGWMNGLIGVLIFSGALPATRVAVTKFDPMLLYEKSIDFSLPVGLTWLIASEARLSPRN